MSTSMALAGTGAGSVFGFVQETVFGETPAAPSLQRVRCRPPSLNTEAENFLNREIGNNRMPKGHRRVAESGTVSLPTQVVFGNVDPFLEAILQGTWATGVPVVGSDQVANGAVNRSFACELHRADAETPYFVLANGCLANTFELQVGADGNEPSLLTIGMLAKEISFGAATVDAGGGYTPASTATPMLNGDWVIQIGGSDFEAIALTLNYSDARDPKRVIGSSTPTGFNPAAGGRSCTLSITGYAESKAHLDRWKNQTEASLSAAGTDVEGNALAISVPTFKVGSISEGQDSGPVRFEMQGQAYSADGSTLLTITRTPA